MTRQWPLTRFLKTNPAIHGFALLALLFSALVPQGFMPSQSANGFSIELCSGHQDNKLAIMPGHPDYDLLAMVYGTPQEEDAPKSETETSVCTYAAASGVSLISTAPTLVVNDTISALHQPAAQRHFPVRNRINIPPATGPPVTI